MLCLSPAALGSDWVGLERSTVLFRDPANAGRRFIPLLLADCKLPDALRRYKYVDYRKDTQAAFDEVVAASSVLSRGTPSGKPLDKGVLGGVVGEMASKIRSILSECCFLLLVDRFPEGLWGRSLAPAAADYGHKEDPGSITVTYWSLQALRRLCLAGALPESDAFLSYLVARKSDRGAVGMRKYVGTQFAPAYAIVEHSRHTAVAAAFFEETQALEHALSCVRFLVEQQHPSGGWSDIVSTPDAEPDPVTTAYVLRTLLDFEAKGLLQQLRPKGLTTFLATFRKRGLHWLQENLRQDGWWLYKKSPDPMSRAYGYTVDVVNILPELADDDPLLRDSHTLVMHNLARAWRRARVGLPTGVGKAEPNLDATAQFAMACWQHRHRYPELAAEFVPGFLRNLHVVLETTVSNAAGWSLAIALIHQVQPELLPLPEVLESSRTLAADLWAAHQTNGRASAIAAIRLRPKWVQQIVADSILPVTLKPM